MSNRVEELESQVAQLEDAVDGLTEELVETRERLSKLEADEGIDNTRTPARRQSAEPDSAPEPDAEAESETRSEPDDADAEAEADAEDDSDSDGNDIIIA